MTTQPEKDQDLQMESHYFGFLDPDPDLYCNQCVRILNTLYNNTDSRNYFVLVSRNQADPDLTIHNEPNPVPVRYKVSGPIWLKSRTLPVR